MDMFISTAATKLVLSGITKYNLRHFIEKKRKLGTKCDTAITRAFQFLLETERQVEVSRISAAANNYQFMLIRVTSQPNPTQQEETRMWSKLHAICPINMCV